MGDINAENLKSFRKSQNFTQRQMADLLGCTERYYQGMEAGQYKPGGAMSKLIEITVGSDVE